MKKLVESFRMFENQQKTAFNRALLLKRALQNIVINNYYLSSWIVHLPKYIGSNGKIMD